jgi:hypothetical protein
MGVKMGYDENAGVSWCEGLGTAGWEGWGERLQEFVDGRLGALQTGK